MTAKILFSSKKIDSVTKEQLQKMLDRYNLGELISFKQTEKGVMKQTIFVSSTSGDYVLKGNPIYEGQFVEEKFFIDHLKARTDIPVPVPYVLDEMKDIFGWPYAIMPRLPGVHFNDPKLEAAMTFNDRIRIARVLARALAEMHAWKSDIFGEFDPIHNTLRPFQGSYQNWLFNEIRFWLEDAKKYSGISQADKDWVEGLLESSRNSFEELQSAAFVMGDFKPENILLQPVEQDWNLYGIIDFTNSYFGDPIADLAKITVLYLDKGEEEFVRHLLSEYAKLTNANVALKERLIIHILYRKVLDWGCAYAINNVTWSKELSFKEWASEFIDNKLLGLIN